MTSSLKRAFLIIATVCAFALSISPLMMHASETRTTPQTFYVSDSGNDKANGRSTSTPWKTLSKVNNESLIPGDRVLFKRGDTWKDQTLSPKGSGDAQANITLSDYGDDSQALPKFEGEGKVANVVLLKDQDHYTISNLDISNQTPGFDATATQSSNANGEKLKELWGIHVTGQNVSVLDGYKLDNLSVHDVTGNVVWATHIGEDGSNEQLAAPGVYKNGGWDASKRTGGIVFECLKPTSDTPTIFKNVSLTNSRLLRDSYSAFTIKQWYGGQNNPGWAMRDNAKAPSYEDAVFKPHENINVSNNYVDQAGAYNCDGIYVTSSKNVTIDNNKVKNGGTSDIEVNLVDNAVVQNNDLSGSTAKVGGADSNAIDADRQTSNILIQKNYIHDNGDGILLCGINFGTSVVRYNVIKDSKAGKNYVNLHGTTGKHYLYNNVFYNATGNSASFIGSTAGNTEVNNAKDKHYFVNNIFYNAGSGVMKIAEGAGTSYDNNAYYGKNLVILSGDQNAVKSDPKFAGTLSANTSLTDLKNLKLAQSSPLIGIGKQVDLSGITVPELTSDFYGNGISDKQLNIGIYQ